MEIIKQERISDRIGEILVKVIGEEKFKTGDKFYSENELAAKLGVSRSSIREAVRSLEVTGWVTVRHGKGIFVASGVDRSREGFMEWIKNNRDELLQHFEVRLLLDPSAAAYAARNATENEIAELVGICGEFSEKLKAGDREGLISVDEKFHFMLGRSAHNKTLFVLIRTMAKSLPIGWITSLHVPGRTDKTVTEHQAIVDAVAAHDENMAEKAMVVHLQNAQREILNLIEN
jgi:GntR family transcriptional repressor for pyruvate dehydrogenase complex